MSIWSAAGSVLAFNAANPKYADLAAGNKYAIILQNATVTDVTAGEFAIECADAKSDDPCAPDVWAPLDVMPACDAAPGTVAGPATISLSAQNPVKANSQCAYAVPCPKQFLRVTPGAATTLDIIVVLTSLKRTGM